MTITFYKYHGTGNDFILIDNRQQLISKNDTKRISQLCDRHFGIGADGLILIEDDNEYDFRMVYFNADGKEGSFCGNGARCTVAFARFLGIINKEARFRASDGIHTARIKGESIQLNMNDLAEIHHKNGAYVLDTGSPHHVQLVEDLENTDVVKEGARLRYGIYGARGSNINFVKQTADNKFYVRTYERGVEDETYSCGTGVTAAALAMHHGGLTDEKSIEIETMGGRLLVHFTPTENGYKDILLEGPAVQVFKGMLTW